MKPSSYQWFDLPFFDDEHDFEYIPEQQHDELDDFVALNGNVIAGNFL
jgi:hypothetical protein